MNLISKLVALLSGAVAIAPAALAQTAADTGVTFAVGYGQVKADDGAGDSIDLSAFQVKAGYRFHTNFGVEGEFGWGAGREQVGTGPSLVSVNIEREAGVFAVGFLPLTPGFSLFARAGYVDFKLKAASSTATASAGDTGTAFGGGLLFDLPANTALRAEYTRYDIDDSADAFAVSLSGKF